MADGNLQGVGSSLSDPVAPTEGGTGLASYTTGDILYASATDVLSNLGAGGVGEVLTMAGGVPSWAAPSAGGSVVQQVRVSTTSTDSTTATFPADGTIPQISEGKELFNVAITPTNTNNILMVEVSGVGGGTNGCKACYCIFQDAIADTLACTANQFGGSDFYSFSFRYYMVAGTVSATTFRFRFGASATETAYINRTSSSAIYSTAPFTMMTVTELTV